MPAPHDLKARSIEFLNIRCNEEDFPKGRAYLPPSMNAYHGGVAAVEGTDAMWKGGHR